ncbi:NADH:flavin oxidoreductase [Tenacibaculum insulae]|uniref:NADH:flavin oxidoreductase n=1 Tax=Tenacibaculum insulae TaxID=2029677 RepID=UPI003AB8CC07
MTKANSSIKFTCGATMKNRFMLAPLTNQQSYENGQLSKDELHWLTMRAKGEFGLVMTCASHVQEIGKGFPGQLGVFNDTLNDGHIKLTQQIKSAGSLAVIQLHHAGMRTPHELINQQPVCPSDNEKTNSRALTLQEVKQLKDDFITAAIRAKNCGYNGAEVHGAHGYILTQFLSSEINNRTDEYGGSLKNRARIIFEIVDGIRKQCGKEFLLGVRLSPERFGMDLDEVKWVCKQLINDGNIDFLDISLWDCFKMPNDEKHQNISLLEHFKNLDFKDVKWTVAGKISNAIDVQKILDAGVDFVSIGTSAILHHNFPRLVIDNPEFEPINIPVSEEYLKKEGLSDTFIKYLKRWPDFIKE